MSLYLLRSIQSAIYEVSQVSEVIHKLTYVLLTIVIMGTLL